MKRNNKKGFTIVELVIVIAVIAVLAAVLIPTFASLIKKANESADIQAARQMNTALAAASVTDKPDSELELIEILAEAGFNSQKALIPITTGCAFYWYKPENLIVLANIGEAEATAQVASILILPVSAAGSEESPVSILYPDPEDQAEDLIDGIVTAIRANDASKIFNLEHGKDWLNAIINDEIKHVEGVELDAETKVISRGSEFTLTATLNPNDATIPEVRWYSTDPEILEVVPNGNSATIKALKGGSATVVVTTVDNGHTDTCTVTVDHEHSYTSAVTEPTCTEEGYTTYTCSSCGDSYVGDKVGVLGHTDAANDGDHRCDRTGCNEDNVTEHTGGTATCTEQAECSDCGAKYGSVKGHSYTTAVTEPTCTDQGYTTHTCGVCGHSYVDDYTPITDHSFGEWETTKEATWTEKGEQQRKCKCGATETREIEAKGLISSLDDLNAALESTENDKIELKLTQSITIDEPITIANEKNVTIDLNGNTLTIDSNEMANVVSVNGTLKITNGNVVIARPEGSAFHECSGICVKENGNLLIENANITADREWNIENHGKTSITGSVITVTGGFGISNKGTKGTVVIKNSKLVAGGEKTGQIYCLAGTMEIINTEFYEDPTNFKGYREYTPIDVFYEGTKVTLDNVTVTTSNDVPNVHAGLGCEVVIKSGTFNDALLCTTEATITLYGGTFCGVEFDNITETSTGFFNEGAKITKADKAWVVTAHEHSYTTVVTEPTCTDQGYTTYTCSSCGDSYVGDYVEVLDHTDADKNHECDVCKGNVGVCEDTNKDHHCDYGCDKYFDTHADSNSDGDHLCDYCNQQDEASICKDDNKDHVCDNDSACAVYKSGSNAHADGDDNNHLCDYGCGKIADEECYDNNKDHKCDECTEDVGVCEDTNKDHNCDYGCGKVYGTCEDKDLDHDCDYGCGKYFGTHADSNSDGDHVCDYGCGAVLEDCSDNIGDKDHKCDVCGKEDVSAHTYSPATCTAPSTCTECGATTGEALGHKYKNLACTVCGDKVVDKEIGAYLPFDNNDNLSDPDGKHGAGVDLSEGYVSTNLKVGTDSFTLSLWIKEKDNGITGDPLLVSNKDWASGDNEGFALFWQRTPEKHEISLNIGIGKGQEYRVDCSYTGMDQINTDDWIHIIAVVDRTNAKASLYINFNKVAESSLEKFGDSSFDWGDYCINIGQDGTGNYGRSLNATVDEFIFFNGALTAEDVAKLADYYSEDYGEEDKVVDKEIGAYLPFDDNTVDDISGNNVTTTGNDNISYTDGKYGTGVDLSEGYVSTDLKVGTDSFTLSFWIKDNGIEGDPVIVGNKDWADGYNNGFALGWEKQEGKNVLLFNVGDYEDDKRADVRYTLPDSYENEWLHIIAVVDRENETVKFYINFTPVDDDKCFDKVGNQNTSLDNVKGLSFDCEDYYINIGQDGTGDYGCSLNAIIDEFIYFDGALTAEDVAKLADYYRKDYSEDYGEVLEVMSFNVYYNNNNKQSVIDQITTYMPDSFGVQEATEEWMGVLNSSFSSNYASVGVGRGTSNPNSSNEYNAIFYNKNKFTCISSGTKWLAEGTPGEPTFTEDGLTHYRIVTWAILERKSDGKRFIHANTHLDDSTQEVREKQAEYLLAILAALSESNPNVPIILTGDFNTDWTKQEGEDNKNKALFNLIADAGYVNAASNALDGDDADHMTYHGYDGESKGETIDFAFVSEDDFTVLYYNVCNETTPAPSDHYALYFEFAFNDK